MHNSLAEWLLYCVFIQPQYIKKWQSQIQIKALVIKLYVLRKNSALLTFVKDLGDLIFNFKVFALIAVQKWVFNMHKQTVQRCLQETTRWLSRQMQCRGNIFILLEERFWAGRHVLFFSYRQRFAFPFCANHLMLWSFITN